MRQMTRCVSGLPAGTLFARVLTASPLLLAWPSPAWAQTQQTVLDLGPIYLVLGVLVAVVAVLLIYIWSLRDRTIRLVSDGAADPDHRASLIAAFNELPLGLPRGSVRAVLALIIVFGSIAFLALSLAHPNYPFPDALTGILGAILGFYFGKGNTDNQALSAVVAATTDTKTAIAKAADATAEAKDAKALAGQATATLTGVQAQHDALATDHLDRITDGLQEAVSIGQTLSAVLPGSFGSTVGAATSALSDTLNTVSDLRKGNLGLAVQKVGQLIDATAPNQPIAAILAQAAQAIGPVLGGAFPPVALITTLIGIGSKLGTAAYTRWIARIMDLPYTPEQFSPTIFDSNAAVSIILQSPAMSQAFGAQIQTDRAMALDIVKLALQPDGGKSLVSKFPEVLGKLDQASIDSAIHELQKASLDYVLQGDVPADAVSAMGGLPKLSQALDKIRADSTASAGLDAVMTAVTTLKQAGKHPETEFLAAAAALAPASAAATTIAAQGKAA